MRRNRDFYSRFNLELPHRFDSRLVCIESKSGFAASQRRCGERQAAPEPCPGHLGESENCGLLAALRRRARAGASLGRCAADFHSPRHLRERGSTEGVMNRRPTAPAPGLVDAGMPKLYALDLSDLPDANASAPADLSGNCGRVGIDVKRRDNLSALFSVSLFLAWPRITGLGLRNKPRPLSRPMNGLDSESRRG